ncbi:hypothetical protein O9992_12895 [Vibrio lentus]|nr:hypothetical protein [Vibrio lentus]
MNYLSALLPDKRTRCHFSGYQAHGTLGRVATRRKTQVLLMTKDIQSQCSNSWHVQYRLMPIKAIQPIYSRNFRSTVLRCI